MEMEINELIKHMAATLFRTKGVYRYRISAGSHGTQKSAPFPGFIFPLSGCAEYHFNDTPYLVCPGTVVHGPADVIMHKRVVGAQEWEYISVFYEICEEPSPLRLAKSHFSLAVGQSPRLYDLLHRLSAASIHPGGLPAFQTETLFRRVLEETFLCVRNQTKHGARELFESVLEYIHSHYMDPLSVSLLAQQSGINENRLYYIFQKYAGMGPGDYLRAYRLNTARERLVTSSVSIGTISEQVGYPDPLYFSRIFKRHFGVSPSEFREHQ